MWFSPSWKTKKTHTQLVFFANSTHCFETWHFNCSEYAEPIKYLTRPPRVFFGVQPKCCAIDIGLNKSTEDVNMMSQNQMYKFMRSAGDCVLRTYTLCYHWIFQVEERLIACLFHHLEFIPAKIGEFDFDIWTLYYDHLNWKWGFFNSFTSFYFCAVKVLIL